MHTQPGLLSHSPFNYFDAFVVIWLIVGIARGRKLGMSQELLPMLKWIAIVALAGYFYAPLAVSVRQNTGFGKLGSSLTAYTIIALLVMIVFVWIKKAIGEKLVGSDLFGGYEYYLGMLGGLIHFACIIVVFLALQNARIYTKEERDAAVAAQIKEIDNSLFPTLPEIKYAISSASFTGVTVRTNLSAVLIKPVAPEDLKRGETLGQKRTDELNDVMGPPKKTPK